MRKRPVLCLFEGLGIELEYMIVDSTNLDVRPLADEVLRKAAGKYTNEFDTGLIGWSNEFVLHVIELKNNHPTSNLSPLSRAFTDHVTRINQILEPWGGQLMPSGMHPWMNPYRETRLWPHRDSHIYETYDRIFNCRNHGWANIQSVQINISFSGDEEFRRLHTSIRLLLPLIPALAASSPIVDGIVTGFRDTRLVYYSMNQSMIPSIMSRVIPETVYTQEEYKHQILERMYKDISEYDHKGILRNEWLNSRGAIPRFERSAMEIRLVDAQESPLADLAISELIIATLKSLVAERWSSHDIQAGWEVEPLVLILEKTICFGEEAVIEDADYLKTFGFPESRALAREVWQHLLEEVLQSGDLSDTEFIAALRVIMQQGPLSRRILRSLSATPSRDHLQTIYRKLCNCLATGSMFLE